MNDTLATATNINTYLSYDDNNKCKFVKYLSIANHPNGNDNSDINVDNDFFFWGYKKNVYYEKYIIRGVQYYICLRVDGNNIPIVRMGNIVKGE